MKTALGAVLATVILMIWGFVSWGILLDALGVVTGPPNEAALMVALKTHIPETGSYFFPMEGYGGSEEEMVTWTARHTDGPVGLLFIHPGGIAPSSAVFAKGFVHFLVSVLLAIVVLKLAAPATYGARVTLVTLLGVFGSVAVAMSMNIWWYVPWSYSLFVLFATGVGWLLAGLVLGKFVQAT